MLYIAGCFPVDQQFLIHGNMEEIVWAVYLSHYVLNGKNNLEL